MYKKIKYAAKMCRIAQQESKDPNTKVGAAIVEKERGIIVSTGFNGLPAGGAISALTRDQKRLLTLHAERNALDFAGRFDLSDCYMVATHLPCAQCYVSILNRGIRNVVWLGDGLCDHWDEHKEVVHLLNNKLIIDTYNENTGEIEYV